MKELTENVNGVYKNKGDNFKLLRSRIKNITNAPALVKRNNVWKETPQDFKRESKLIGGMCVTSDTHELV